MLKESATRIADRTSPYQLGLCLLGLTLFSLTYQGVFFGLGEGDHSIHVPFIRYFNQPQLYPHDLLVSSASQYFTYYLKLMTLAAKFIPLEKLYFGLHCLARLAWIWAIYYLGRTWDLKPPAALLGAAMLALPKVFFHFSPLARGLIHSAIAWPLLLLALAWIWRERYLAAFLVIGVTFNLHPLLTTYLSIIVAALFLYRLTSGHDYSWLKTALPGAALALLLAWPTLSWIINSLTQTTSISPQWQALNLARHKHFSKPAAWSIAIYLEFFFLLLLFLHGMFSKSRQLSRTWLVYGLSVMLLTLIGLPFFPWQMKTFLFKAQFVRASQFFYFPALLFSADLIYRSVESQPTGSRYFLASLSALSLIFIQGIAYGTNLILFCGFLIFLAARYLADKKRVDLVVFMIWLVMTLVGLGRIIIFTWSLPPTHALNNMHSISWQTVGGVFLSSALLSLAILFRKSRWGFRLGLTAALLVLGGLCWQQAQLNQRQKKRLDTWREVQLWAQEQTSLDSVFITPPQLDGWQVFSQRSGVFDYKSLTSIHWGPQNTEQWIERLNDFGYDLKRDARRDMRRLLARSYSKFSAAYFQGLAQKYGADYLVTRSTRKLPFVRLYQNTAFTVYQVAASEADH